MKSKDEDLKIVQILKWPIIEPSLDSAKGSKCKEH